MLRAILNKSSRQHPTKQQLYGHLPPIMKTIQVRWTRYVEHCWRSRDKLISDILPRTPSYGLAKVERPARTYIQQFSADTWCSFEDLPEAKDNRERWRERVRDIHADGAAWWWWWNSSISNNLIELKSFLCTQFKCQTFPIWPRDRTLSGVTTTGHSGPRIDDNDGGYSAFPKAPPLLEPHHQIVWWVGVLPFCMLCLCAVCVSIGLIWFLCLMVYQPSWVI